MSKTKSINNQVGHILSQKICCGEKRYDAKHDPKNTGKTLEGIYSWGTYNTYKRDCVRFGEWVKSNYGIKDVTAMKPYAAEYLKAKESEGLSAYTLSTYGAALAKLYGCSISDFKADLPERRRADITRSRGEIKDFSEKKHADLIDFCKATGLRRHELLQIEKKDIYWDKGEFGEKRQTLIVHVQQGKGGKSRDVPIIEGKEYSVLKMLDGLKPKDKVFKKSDIPNRTPVHKYRAEYAKEQYNRLERDLSKLSKEEKYYCRNDKKGVVYDKDAMHKVSEMLGHNRIDVIAKHYLY